MSYTETKPTNKPIYLPAINITTKSDKNEKKKTWNQQS